MSYVPFNRMMVRVIQAGACLVWTGPTAGEGYGNTTFGTRDRLYVHRIAVEATTGEIPPGMEVDHLCRNRVCVNPDHLEVVTHEENVRRARAWFVKPVCPRGHDDFFIDKTNARHCRVCDRDRKRSKYVPKALREAA